MLETSKVVFLAHNPQRRLFQQWSYEVPFQYWFFFSIGKRCWLKARTFTVLFLLTEDDQSDSKGSDTRRGGEHGESDWHRCQGAAETEQSPRNLSSEFILLFGYVVFSVCMFIKMTLLLSRRMFLRLRS